MDEWGIDAVYTSTQKALSGPAGITPVAFSARAEKVINSRKHEPPFYFDVKLLAQQWNCYGNTRAYHHTLSPPLLWALRASLIELCRETLPKAWERHTKTAAHFHKRLSDFGFELLIPKPEDRLNTVTTVLINKKYNIPEFLNSSHWPNGSKFNSTSGGRRSFSYGGHISSTYQVITMNGPLKYLSSLLL
ncbi:unnamed protein product [Leptidea sinapis]|uniref:Aminotransferase class V domain-containing protein n=1 Tax=Leptidea sinapis TaxID=189913 RepID=A0A5E4PU48_9NEOP|nr:unnamed protein product [Leptidea sinapis]